MCKKTALRKLLSYVIAIAMVLSMANYQAFAGNPGEGSGGGSGGEDPGADPGDYTVAFNIQPAEISDVATIRVQGSSGEDYGLYEVRDDVAIFLLDNGEYMYTIRAEGYLTKMGTITVNGDITETVTLAPTPPSTLRLRGMGQDHNNGPNTGGPNGTKRDMEVEGSGYVGWLRPPAWIKFANVNLLGGIQQYAVNYAIDGSGTVNLGFDVRVANPGSTFDQAVSIGSLALTQRTGGWGSPGRIATQTVINSDKIGVCDLYVVFTSGEYNFGYLDLALKPETGGIKEYDVNFKVRPYDAEVVVEDLGGTVVEPTTDGGKKYKLEEAFYRYTVSKSGYESKTVVLPLDSSKTIMTVLLPEGANTYDRYEAEDGAITGGEIINRTEFSQGKGVGSFTTSNSLGSLNSTFSNISNVKFSVDADTTGIAEIIIGYNSSVTAGNQDRIAIKSNDGTAKEVYLNPGRESTAFVDLRAGTNTIYVSNVLNPRITNGGNAWLDLDYLDVNDMLVPGSVEPGELDSPYVQPKNPIIKSIFTADPEAHVWPTDPNNLYLYPSHDIYPSRGCDLMDQYHVFSTENMTDWVDEGEILRADDVAWGRAEGGFMWAPDAAYKDGYYYFYWPQPTGTDWGTTWQTGVIRSRYPDKGFEEIQAEGFNGYIEGAGGDGMIDVKVFTDDDGEAYIYIGGSQRLFQGKLKDDMITLDGPLTRVDPAAVPSYHEGPSVFKRNGIYYLIYPGGSASSSGYNGDKFNYSTSNSPLGPWEYRGYFFNPTGSDTSHGSIVKFRDIWYLFYHTQDLSGNGTLRSVSVDEVIFNEDGTIQLFTKTLDGVEQNGPDYIRPQGTIYDASVAEVGGGAVKSLDSAASQGGAIVTDLNKAGAYVEFTNVDGGDGGRANIVFHYAAPDQLPKLKLIVNGFDYSFVNMPFTGGRSFFTGESSFTVKRLNPGETNTIRLVGDNARVNLNYIEVIPFDESVPPPGHHTITVLTDENGTALADKASAPVGEKVTLTVTPNEGYSFKEWQVTEPDSLTIASDNTFAMPNENVTIMPVFQSDMPTEDITAPVWPEGSAVTASAIETDRLTLTWTEAEDDTGVAEYFIYEIGNDTEPIVTVEGNVTSYDVTGLQADTLYSFSVQAGDRAGNVSENGPEVSVTTLPDDIETPEDITAPVWPEESAVTASAIKTNKLTLTWTEAEDDTGVTEYLIYEIGNDTEPIATVGGNVNSYNVTGLSSRTKYTFSVQAGDLAGNISEDGPVATVTTKSSSSGGTVGSDTPPRTPVTPAAPAVPFSDVSQDDWYYEAVTFIAEKGITTGTGDGKFSPNAKLTRSQFIVMLMKAYAIAPDAAPSDNFSDAGNTYYTGYLAAAKRLNITAGVGGNMYAPEKEITRQEMFTMLYNTLKVIGKLPQGSDGQSLSSFSDAGQVASWAEESMNALTAAGIVSGSDGKLSPASTTTRAEMAQVLYNLLKN